MAVSLHEIECKFKCEYINHTAFPRIHIGFLESLILLKVDIHFPASILAGQNPEHPLKTVPRSYVLSTTTSDLSSQINLLYPLLLLIYFSSINQKPRLQLLCLIKHSVHYYLFHLAKSMFCVFLFFLFKVTVIEHT